MQGPEESVTYWNAWDFRPLSSPRGHEFATRFATTWRSNLLGLEVVGAGEASCSQKNVPFNLAGSHSCLSRAMLWAQQVSTECRPALSYRRLF